MAPSLIRVLSQILVLTALKMTLTTISEKKIFGKCVNYIFLWSSIAKHFELACTMNKEDFWVPVSKKKINEFKTRKDLRA